MTSHGGEDVETGELVGVQTGLATMEIMERFLKNLKPCPNIQLHHSWEYTQGTLHPTVEILAHPWSLLPEIGNSLEVHQLITG